MSIRRTSLGLVERLRDALVPPRTVFAHCDIPCGIYDPHEAQIAALTILRMDQLIKELPKGSASASAEEREAYVSKVSRYMLVKEQHAEKLKQEVRVIWGDYITADHLKQHPTLHETVFRILKASSKARHGTNLAEAEELVKIVQEFSEIFWKTKGVPTKRLPSQQKSGGEIVYPAA